MSEELRHVERQIERLEIAVLLLARVVMRDANELHKLEKSLRPTRDLSEAVVTVTTPGAAN